MIDLGCSIGLLVVIAAVVLAYAVRVARGGALHHARIDEAGSSALLGKGAMEAGYFGLMPMARIVAAIGLTANGVTLLSLGFGLVAAVALALGHFGVGALFTALATLCDALDGIVARLNETASDAGEVFDAAVDRYQEFAFLAALAIYFRKEPLWLVVALLALLASFMVSYGTAKAEALGVASPRGAMRRVERAVYLGGGVVFVPIAAAVAARFSLPLWIGRAPIFFALALVAIVGNVSAARRLAAITRAVAARDAHRPPPPAPTPHVVREGSR
ncbi:CDP-diacylglycerol--glycerol-3-phosphate 3-phosphatidyltransferase [Minicystis rosea]|nr:CDP-diacylglycerol--glycerol-3-phosphate 3-phosphatidyltransferase [Minicystis rosea]